MGRFTELSLDQARALGAGFGVEVASVESLPEGSVNSNFRLTDASGARYFGRIYEEQGEDGAAGELRLLTELARVSVPTTRPLTFSGGVAASVAGKPFALYPWIDGDILCHARVTEAYCAVVGRALAELHLATPRVTTLAGGRFRVEDLFARLDRIEKESPEHRDAALHIRRRLHHYTGRRDAGLPSGVIHGDLFRDNVLWSGERIAALIDFESASNGPFAFDLMVTIHAWCYGDAFRPDLVGALLRGYDAVRHLEPSEHAGLLVEGALAALRFATTRITDFSMRAAPGQPPLRDYRRFLGRLEALEHGMLEPHLAALGV
ncbi:MAG TPA: homoserine kinase [Polyangiaceae bacterium]|nr:homoserine kinase [Polyangiaceae bacterium]